jgi:hypothetical protein
LTKAAEAGRALRIGVVVVVVVVTVVVVVLSPLTSSPLSVAK